MTSKKENSVKNSDSVNKKNIMPDDLKKVLKFNETLTDLKKKIGTEIDTLKQLKGELRKMEQNYQQDLMKVWKSKKKRANSGDKTGFIKNKRLPKKLADLIGVAEGTEMSMPTYTSKFYEQVLNKKGLLYEKDKRVFRANKELMEILGLPESVNNSTDYRDKNGFNFSTLQKYFSKIMKEEGDNEEIRNDNVEKLKEKVNVEKSEKANVDKSEKKIEVKPKVVSKNKDKNNKSREAKA